MFRSTLVPALAIVALVFVALVALTAFAVTPLWSLLVAGGILVALCVAALVVVIRD